LGYFPLQHFNQLIIAYAMKTRGQLRIGREIAEVKALSHEDLAVSRSLVRWNSPGRLWQRRGFQRGRLLTRSIESGRSVKIDAIRKLALLLPEVVQQPHFHFSSFRVAWEDFGDGSAR
jgi:hypothetical protein